MGFFSKIFGSSSTATAKATTEIDFSPTTIVNFDTDSLVEAIESGNEEDKEIELKKLDFLALEAQQKNVQLLLKKKEILTNQNFIKKIEEHTPTILLGAVLLAFFLKGKNKK